MLWLLFACINVVHAVTDMNCNFKLPCKVDTEVLVVGGGLCGCSTAFHVAQKSNSVMLTESEDHLGGNIRSQQDNGFTWEEGANSFQITPTMKKVSADLNVTEKLIVAPPLLRYVYKKKRLVPLPDTVYSFLRTRLLSTRGKLKFLAGVMGFVNQWKGTPSGSGPSTESIKSFMCRHFGEEIYNKVVDPFVSGVYAGNGAVLSMKDCFPRIHILESWGRTRGLIEGSIAKSKHDKREENAKKKGSHTDAVQSKMVQASSNKTAKDVPIGSLASYKGGISTFVNEIGKSLGSDRVKVSYRLIKLLMHCNPSIGQTSTDTMDNVTYYSAYFETPAGIKIITTRKLVLSLPAFITADIFENCTFSSIPQDGSKRDLVAESHCTKVKDTTMHHIVDSLMNVSYCSVAAVLLAYPRESIKHDLKGFGHLIPRGSGLQMLGSIWASSLFQGRAPDGWVTLVNFLGGAHNGTVVNPNVTTDKEMVEIIHGELKGLIGDENTSVPLMSRPVPVLDAQGEALPLKKQAHVLGIRRWMKGIPQYTSGHRDAMLQAQDELRHTLPNVYLSGNYMSGVSVSDCIQHGVDIAERITE